MPRAPWAASEGALRRGAGVRHTVTRITRFIGRCLQIFALSDELSLTYNVSRAVCVVGSISAGTSATCMQQSEEKSMNYDGWWLSGRMRRVNGWAQRHNRRADLSVSLPFCEQAGA